MPTGTGESIDRRRMATVKIYTDKAGEFRWRLVAFNGQNLCESGEGFKTRAGAVNNWKAVRRRFAGDLIDETGIDAMKRREAR